MERDIEFTVTRLKLWLTRLMSTFAIAVGGLTTSPSSAAPTFEVLDLTGLQSFDDQGSTFNTVLSQVIAEDARLVRISWEGTLSTTTPSWLSEFAFTFSNASTDAQLTLLPAPYDEFDGHGTYADTFDLEAFGVDIAFDAGHALEVELWETYDDFPGQPDAQWINGSLTLEFQPHVSSVPEPSTLSFFLTLVPLMWLLRHQFPSQRRVVHPT